MVKYKLDHREFYLELNSIFFSKKNSYAQKLFKIRQINFLKVENKSVIPFPGWMFYKKRIRVTN